MVVYAIHYSNPSLRQAQDKLAQGDNHSENSGAIALTTITAKLFQIVISKAKEHNDS
jgi:hypothetical protein